MNTRRFVVTSLAVYIAYELVSSVFTVIIFGGVWELALTFGDLVWAFVFVYLFTKSTAGGLLNGMRFGFFPMGAITHASPELSHWIIPGLIPSVKTIFWFGLTLVKYILCGGLTAFLYGTTLP